MSEIQRPKDTKPKAKFNIYWIYALILVGLIAVQFFSNKERPVEISWTQMEEHLLNDRVEKILCINHKSQVHISIKPESMAMVFGDNVRTDKAPVLFVIIPSAERFSEFIEQFKNTHSLDDIDVKYDDTSNTFLSVLINLAPFVLLIAIWIFIMRKMAAGGAGGGGGAGGIFSVGKSKARLFEKGGENPISFKDVAGLSEAKQEVEEIVAFLKNPAKYTELGGKIPKGALLVGPPGTGKTLLAKAVAGEADVPFFSLSGSDFVEMFVGVGASRVRDLFRQAKEKAPCIVFIDEIDAVGRARGKNPNMGANDERENTLNQLLTEMDGFGSNSGVIILAATNRADILDKALLRAGRFDRQINVDLPDINERLEIFQVHLRPIKTDDSIDPEFMARQTPGFSGADIANVCNESALIAARKGKNQVQKQDFLDAVDRIIGGLEKKNKITTAEERRSIAVHEAGHATLSWLLEYAHPLIKVTIVPRGKALGAAWYLPEERQLTTKEQMLDEMCSTLGGRAAEDLFIGAISTGALNDLERVTKQAYAIVAYFGMSKNLHNISYFDSTGSSEFSFSKPYSEKTAELIDKELKALVDEQYQRAKKILSEHKEGHNRLADMLVEREVIFAEDLEQVFGKRQWTSRMEEVLESQKQQKQNEDSSSDSPDLPSEEAAEQGDLAKESGEREQPSETFEESADQIQSEENKDPSPKK